VTIHVFAESIHVVAFVCVCVVVPVIIYIIHALTSVQGFWSHGIKIPITLAVGLQNSLYYCTSRDISEMVPDRVVVL